MEEYQAQPTSHIETPRKKNGLKITLGIVGALLIAGAAAYGVYMWQQQEVANLNTKVANLESQKSTTEQMSGTSDAKLVTYKSKVGGMTLTLPKEYSLILNVDGNKGGAPGSTFKIGKNVSSGIIEDNVYQWVQIDIEQRTGDLSGEVKTISSQLTNDGFSNIKTEDGKVDGQAAKIITADGVSYDAKRRVYVLKSGDYFYRITSKTLDSSKDDDLLRAVLENIKIEAKNFN